MHRSRLDPLVREWNQTATSFLWYASIPAAFEAQAARTPDAIALAFGDEQLTYAELDRRANRLANRLRAHGVRSETLVGVCLRRSAPAIIALVAVLKAGGAYVPLDPDEPSERLGILLTETRAALVLTHGDLVDRFLDFGARAFAVESELEANGSEASVDGAAWTTPDALAYVIYTSGSTGVPKGVAVSHRSVLRLVLGTDYVRLDAQDVVAQASTLTFDAATFEVWGALVSGARLAGVDRDTAISPPSLAAAIRELGVSTLFLTTALFNHVVSESPAAFGSLRHLLFGGEAVNADRTRQLLSGDAPLRLLHVYGPTETTTFALWHHVIDVPSTATTVPIGRPLANTTAYVLDRDFAPSPIGAIGELAVGGPGVARGYLRRPEPSAEKFVPDPFAGQPGARLYRTGDLVRREPCGDIVFIGRVDNQVKIRGFRIEPAEIEAALLAHASIAGAAVTACPDIGGSKRLIAYVVPRDPTSASVGAWRAFLKDRLPDYMIPAGFVSLGALPLNANGKVDRRKLPDPDLHLLREAEHVTPRGPIEEALAGIWAAVLKREHIGIRDDFFSLGGHSLLATQVVARVRDGLGVELPIQSVFEAPTVAALARRVEAGFRDSRDAATSPIRRIPRNGPLAPSFAQERLWFLDRFEQNSAFYNIATALRIVGSFDAFAWREALQAIARRHEVLRTTLADVDGRPAQIVRDGVVIEMPIEDLRSMESTARDAAARRCVHDEACRVFDLARGPLVRARLIRLDDREHIAVVTMHHIVSDGWSMGILHRELSALYTALSRGESSPLPELALQYADWAAWQRRWLEAGTLETQLAYWRGQLDGAPPSVDLPSDRPRPRVQTFRGACLDDAIPAELVRAVGTLGRDNGATPFMVLLAAFAALLSRYAGQDDIVVGSPIANRTHGETENLIGFFVNTLVLRTDLSGAPSFVELLSRVKATCLDAYANQDVPFERLVEDLQPERDVGRTPLFNVMFALQNAPQSALELRGAALTPLAVDLETAKFDLTVSVTETAQGMTTEWSYSTDLFDARTVEQMAKQYRALLAHAVVEPRQTVGDLSLLEDEERQRLLSRWNTIECSPALEPVHVLFGDQARRTPDAIAVVCAEHQLTYREVDDRANRVARGLRRFGAGPERRVGILMDRCGEMVVAVLGVLKAAAAYLALDPDRPDEQLCSIIEEADIRVAVALDRDAARAAALGLRVLSFEHDPEPTGAGASAEAGSSGVTPRHLACILYPSSSAGTRAGVLVEHGELSRHVRVAAEALELPRAASFAMAEPLTAHTSVTALYAPLVDGGLLHVVSRDVAQSGAALAAYLVCHRIQCLTIGSSHWAVVGAADPLPIPEARLIVSGEMPPSTLIRRAAASAPQCVLFRHDGPKETTGVWSHRVAIDGRRASVSLRSQRAKPRVYLLDRRGGPVPAGVLGDLFIGGADVARGYVARPGSTADRFVPDPFGGGCGARLCATGERARSLGDGSIELFGRMDERMEARLVRTHKSAPPTLEPEAPNAQAQPQAPRSPIEEVLASLFVDLLRARRVGAHDDFFALGGHSLLATQLVSRIGKSFGVELPVRAVFEAPTVAALAERVGAALRSGAITIRPPIAPLPRDGPLEPSFAQERLWFLDQLAPGSGAYNVPSALHVEGPLDVAAWIAAIREIVRRHEVLRTTLPDVEGHSVVHVNERVELDVSVLDFGSVSSAQRAEHARRWVREEAWKPFDLSRGPLVRAAVVRFDDEEHVVLLTMHHIVSDGWSSGVLWRELAALYPAFARGEPSPLCELSLQYADWAAWQRRWLQAGALEAQLAYWRAQLDGAPASLDLPRDRPRPRVQTFRGGCVDAALPPEVTRALDELAQRGGASRFMVLLAAFAALLSRYSGQDDVVVGSPIANRTHAETEDLIGFFVNTLVLRTDLSDNPSFGELVSRVKDTCLAAYANQDIPFERLVEELQPDRDLASTPLFNVMFALQNAPPVALRLPGVSVDSIPVEDEPAKFDLTVSVTETASGIVTQWSYPTDLFDATTVVGMAKHYCTLVERALAEPSRRIAEVSLLDDADRHRVLVEWNATETPVAFEPVHVRFAEQARSRPECVAIVFDEHQLTYRELDERADRLARRLMQCGLGRECRIGILMNRCPEMAIAVLGVLKADAAYVPLDPEHPDERLRFIVEDADIDRIVVLDRDRARAEELGVRALLIGELADFADPAPSGRTAASAITSNDLAYVLYTSGSTGRPKGVLVEHGALASYLHAAARALDLPRQASFAMVQPLAVDSSVTAFYSPLLDGGVLHLVPRETALDGAALAAYLARHRIQCLKIAPSHLGALSGGERVPMPEARLVLGGESPPPGLIRRTAAAAPGCVLFNHYGPTETTVAVVSHRIQTSVIGASIPLGTPHPNTRVYVLDGLAGPVPIGVLGELFIGGANVARGYVGRPAATAARFVPDPFGSTCGARLYATGDRVRWLGDGTLEFFGRVDEQIKVRGFRIEPAEIEAALYGLQGVAEAFVKTMSSDEGSQLVAYVVLRSEGATTSEALRRALLQLLPEPMVPRSYVFLDALPRTGQGKIDRRALPAPEIDAPNSQVQRPRSPIEAALAGSFAELLRTKRVGAHDDFFALGGHSLLATQLVARIAKSFGVELPVRAVFEAPTVAALAERVAASLRSGARPTIPPIAPLTGERPLEPSFAQERLWFLDRLTPESGTYNIPTALRLVGPIDVNAWKAALSEIVRRHEVLRTTLPEVAGRCSLHVQEHVEVDVPVLDFRGVPPVDRAEYAQRWLREEGWKPFDLSRGPLVRAALARVDDEEHVALVTTHHIVSDGWSSGVLWGELAALYAAFARGEPSPLRELPLQYTDWAAWQRRWLEGGALETQLAYWRKQLEGAPASLDLPADRPRRRVQTFRGAHVDAELTPALVGALDELGQRYGATRFMVLLAAFAALLSRYAGQEDVVVGSPIANRTNAETENLIGFFVNTLVLRTDLSGEPTFVELVMRVKETCLAAYANQDVPFERLVEDLQPERDLASTPLFNVMFALQNAPTTTFALPGVCAEPVAVEDEPAKFDLALDVGERRQALALSWWYNADLFDEATIAGIAGHFRALLERLVSAPTEAVTEIPLITLDERNELVRVFNATEADFPRDVRVHELVESVVDRTPMATAVVFGDHRISYAELDRRANRVAHALLARGVNAETPVALCLRRSLEMVIGVLAVLKAGGAYVPLDPEYPPERLAFMFRDSGAEVLLTERALLENLPCGVARTLCIDADAAAIDRESEARPTSRIGADQLAYIIYTSGSSGRPKGVQVSHRNVVNLLSSMQRDPGLASTDVVAAVTSLSFDIAGLELFLPLVSGAQVIVVGTEHARDGGALGEDLALSSATVMQATPTMWRLLVESGWTSSGALRALCGGEALRSGLAREIAARASSVHNVYGPTETTIWSTVHEIVSDSEVRLGRPIANTTAHVLDRHLVLVPVGVVGELHLGGVGVTRGYLDRPALTAERFLPDALSLQAGARSYRTGDLVRRDRGGALDFLGRVDHQVKVRGYRIELGEIERVLLEHPAVRAAVVVARVDAADQQLVAYVVAVDEARALSGDELRAWLATRLPTYMLPSAFVELDAVPLTPSGKIDRNALPVPEASQSRSERIPARDALDDWLVELWTVLLGRPVGITDDFFDVGGHSLLALRLVAAIKDAFGVSLPVASLFEISTIAAIADRLKELGVRLD